ncbi:MAG: DUF4197 domain-containing protein [Acidobacteriota bacterium]|jgi:hypothetical protein|nr:DUF4197 domain-containing protein [Acidobacteriota bacterium]
MRKLNRLKSVSFAMVLFLLMSLSIDASAQIFGRNSNRNNQRNTNISDSKVSLGLKEALTKGVIFAVDNLGREDGFYDNASVRIPLPKSLQSVARVARFAGYADRVDAFELSLNRAAEKAVPVAVDVFVDSIRQMTFTDAKNILFSGQDDAATQFFRRTTEDRLRGKFRPIVEDFTGETGVTQSYKAMMDKAGFVAMFLGDDAKDLDGYITEKALDGVFYVVAQEEKKIRKDPIGRTTQILRDVFGILR